VKAARVNLPGLNKQVILYLLYSGLFYIGLIGITDVSLNFYFVSLGHNLETIGILQGLPRLGGLLTGIPVGILANRIGARRVTIYATLCAAATYPMLVIWPSLYMLAFSRFMLGLFFGATQITSAPIMMTLTESRYQTHQFSYHSLITMSATALGSLIAGFMPILIVNVGIPAWAILEGIPDAQTPFTYGSVLVLGGAIIAASSIPLLWLLDAAKQNDHVSLAKAKNDIPWAHLVFISVPFLFFGFTGGLTFPFYNLFFRVSFGVADDTVGIILSLGWLGMGIVTLANPWWDKHFGRARALGMTMTIAAMAFLALSVAPTLGLSIIAFVGSRH